MKRVLTALVLIPLFILSVMAPNPLYFQALVVLAAIQCAREFGVIAAAGSAKPFGLLSLAWAGALAGWPSLPPAVGIDVLLAAGLLVLPPCAIFLRKDLRRALLATAATIFAAIYTGFLLGYVAALRLADGGEGWRLVFLLTAGVWAGDTGAYYVGKTFGRHKLNAKVSPKKTWEGAAGNVAGSLAGTALVQAFLIPAMRPVHVVALGVSFAVVGMFGDLFESVFKRGAGVKDSSRLLPGHGGLLDRLDSLFFAAPVLYYYHQVFLS